MSGDILELIKDEEVIASGDGQSDSPGHSAKYLTYFLMLSGQEEYIIHIECLDKREVGGKSPNMEREALKRAINYLKNVINLKEVVTDASSSGIKMMGKFRVATCMQSSIWIYQYVLHNLGGAILFNLNITPMLSY